MISFLAVLLVVGTLLFLHFFLVLKHSDDYRIRVMQIIQLEIN